MVWCCRLQREESRRESTDRDGNDRFCLGHLHGQVPPPPLHCRNSNLSNKSYNVTALNLLTTGLSLNTSASARLWPCLHLVRWEAQTGESSSLQHTIHPNLDRRDPFRMSNGPENTVTFSYLTLKLLWVFIFSYLPVWTPYFPVCVARKGCVSHFSRFVDKLRPLWSGSPWPTWAREW